MYSKDKIGLTWHTGIRDCRYGKKIAIKNVELLSYKKEKDEKTFPSFFFINKNNFLQCNIFIISGCVAGNIGYNYGNGILSATSFFHR